MTVNSSNSGVTRHGEYFFKGHSLSNNPNAVFSTLAVSDGTTTTNIGAFLAGTPEAFTYDDDGNLLPDGRWDYTYDAENRLVSMQTHTALSPTPLANADARRIEFKNDYLGRRVQKTVRDGWNGSTYTTVLSDEKFVYDGWNAIAKLNALSSNALVASYYWGIDWSGTLQGAGGVGGLALTVEGGSSYLPMFDGNGNVMGLIKASTGLIDAAYEYDAFGNTLRESGTYAATNPWRFSTKYTDIETSLVYYGHRFYSPTLGRFINKDPIEEQGGLNLYSFCFNNSVNAWDVLGMGVDGAGLYDIHQLDGGGGRDNLGFDTSGGRSAPTVNNPSSDQRDAMDAASRLRAAIATLAQTIEVRSGFTLSSTEAAGAAAQAMGIYAAGPSDAMSFIVVSNTPGIAATISGRYASTDNTQMLKALAANLPPKLGDMRYSEASIGVASWVLGPPGKFDDGKAAILDFADAMDHPLSPYSLSHGLPPNIFSSALADRIDVLWGLIDFAGGKASPGISNIAGNYLEAYKGIMNKVGPWQAFTITQTQTYAQTSWLFGLIKNNQWVDGPRTYTSINTGPAAGYFFSPEEAALAAKEALKNQLRKGPP